MPCPYCDSSDTRFLFSIDDYAIDRCSKCGVVFYNPLPTPEEQVEFYQREWAQNASHYRTNYLNPESERANLTDNLLPNLDMIESQVPTGRLMDVGCSAGAFLEAAIQRGWHAMGCDLGADACELARQRTNCTVYCGALESLQLPDGFLDAIHAAQVIEHVLQPKAFVGEARRVLRTGGALVVAAPVIEPRVFKTNFHIQRMLVPRISGGREMPFPWALDHPYHVIVPCREALCQLLENGGFQVVRWRLVGWQHFHGMNRKWRLFYHVMNGMFSLLNSGMNVSVLAVKK